MYVGKTARINYRFKDNMGYVFFKTFKTDREAHLWYERNKISFAIKEMGRLGYVYKNPTILTYVDI